MPHCDNFCNNTTSHNYLIFFVELKTENQLIRFEGRVIETWFGIQKSVLDHAVGQWMVCLMYVCMFESQRKALYTCYDVLFNICLKFVMNQ